MKIIHPLRQCERCFLGRPFSAHKTGKITVFWPAGGVSFFNDASNGAGLMLLLLIGFIYQLCAHLPKKKFSNLRRCEEG
ncbi:hypothetical protein, partial [Escherichia coli]|uniref:hypothetical protein n=1 Tax=Escherichia coli TaxID=562 RepID=UPI001BC84F99